MKNRFAQVFSAALVGAVLTCSCAVRQTAAPNPQPVAGKTATAIPSRPEKLSFLPLVYEPPAPDQYRVALKSGPVAYVAPDRELPLVNVAVFVRGGEYLDPSGKEGLVNLTAYLLARGGIK